MIAPKLRFSEFKDDWKKEPLGKVVNFLNGKRIPLSEAERKLRQGEYRYYGASGVIDYIDDYIFDGQYILIGEDGANILTRSSPLAFVVEGKFWVNNHAHIFQSKTGKNQFLATYLESLNYEKHNSGTAQPKLNLENLKKVEVANPSTEEQTKIAEFLSAVDDKISQLSRELELLNQYKKGIMQKIFSQEIRFKNANGEDFEDWDYVKLQDVSERVTRKNKEHNQNALTISAQFGLINQQEFFSKQIASRDMSNYYLLHKGEFAYNKSYSTGYPMGAIKRLDRYDKGVVSTLYICFALKPLIDSNFFQHYVDSGELVQELSSVAQEGARNHGLLNISLSDFFSVDLFVPSLPEQKKIEEFLTAIDERIDHTTAELTQTKQWKKGLLQQMFV